ncbi:ionotropic receptor 21a-like [Anthonomus grandis grandis]|uniref:ionotropic receptor 21a-like n=1 Tax=Anthonomus grandis grandis TaxID=2921223 RepID=UPI002165C4C6|nr:ionotropic receptor 21a-like [Anthonomus grandis grandis]
MNTILIILMVHILIQVSGKLNFIQNPPFKNYEVYAKHFEESLTIQITMLHNDTAKEVNDDLLTEFLEMNMQFNKGLYVVSKKVDTVNLEKLKRPKQPVQLITKSPKNASNKTINALLRARLKYLYYYLVRIYIVNDADMFLQYLTSLDIHRFLAMARTLTVIIFSSHEADLEAMQALFLHLWQKYSILNVIGQFPNTSKREYVFTYKPFISNLHGYGTFHSYHYKFCLKNPQLLLSNLQQLNGYRLRLSLFLRYPSSTDRIPKALKENPIYRYVHRSSIKLYGLDAIMMSELARKMNFSVEMYEGPLGRTYGVVNADGTPDGTLKAVVDRNIDIQGNARFIIVYPIKGYEYTYRFYRDNLCLIAPTAGHLPKWNAMLQFFTTNFGLLLVVNCFIFGLLNKWFSGSQIKYSVSMFEVFGVFVGQAVYSSHNTRPQSHRLFFLSILVYSLVMSTIFTAILLLIFTKPVSLPEINTLEEFLKTGHEIMTSNNVFKNIPRQPYIDLAKRVKMKPPGSNLSSIKLAAKFKIGGLERYYDAQIQIKTTLADKNGNEVLHIVEECINTYNLAFILPLGSPYLVLINRMIMWAAETGLSLKWYNDFALFYIYQYQMHQIEQRSIENEETSGFSKLNFEDFKGALLILIIGNGLAAVVFLLEICWGYFVLHISKSNCI